MEEGQPSPQYKTGQTYRINYNNGTRLELVWNGEHFITKGQCNLTGQASTTSGGQDHHGQANKDIVQCNLKMLNSGLMADVEFKVGIYPDRREVFKAHKYVLVSRSPVFEAMFTTNMTEKQSNEVTIDDMDPETFSEMLSFLYVDVAKPSKSNVSELYHASRKYILPKLEAQCIAMIKGNLTDLNVFDLLNYNSELDETQLTSLSVNYISQRFSYLSKTEAFLGISDSSLCALLASDSLDLPEEDIYQCSIRWAKSQLTKKGEEVTDNNIRGALGRAFNLIRFPIMANVAFAVQAAKQNVLTAEEKNSIYNYMIAKDLQGNCDQIHGFSVVPRKPVDHLLKFDVLNFNDSSGLWHTALETMSMKFWIDKPVIFRGFAFHSSQNESVVENLTVLIARGPNKGGQKNQILKKVQVHDLLCPGGTVLIPVLLAEPLMLRNAHGWLYIRVVITQQANAARKSFSYSNNSLSQKKNVDGVTFNFAWKQDDCSIKCDPIPQLLFSRLQ